jgi:hypothetical protein
MSEEKSKNIPHSAPGSSTMTTCDLLTMETMLNMDVYSKYLNQKQQQRKNAGEGHDTCHAAERKFYRRRIMDITRELFRCGVSGVSGVEPIQEPPPAAHAASTTRHDSVVVSTYNAYVRACIMHFKFIDLADTLQDEYTDLTDRVSSVPDDPLIPSEEVVSEINKICFNANANLNASNVVASNSKVIKVQAPAVNALEKLFVAKTDNKPQTSLQTSPPPSPSKTKMRIPKTKDVDLMDERFKTKGVKSRPPSKSKMNTDDANSASNDATTTNANTNTLINNN